VLERLSDALMKGMALCVMLIGIMGAIETQNIMIVILSVMFGVIIGELLRLQSGVERLGVKLEELIGSMTASQYVTIIIVMTLSIMIGIWLVPVLCKRMQTGLLKFEKKDAKWSDILQNSLFIGMISAFVGFVFCDLGRLWLSEGGVFTDYVKNSDGVMEPVYYTSTSGLVPVFVMLVSALAMCVCGLFVNKPRFKWVNDYALPICMLIGMAAAIPLTMLFGGAL
jgi:hypothetical protein